MIGLRKISENNLQKIILYAINTKTIKVHTINQRL
jgi:hypothetical protein